MLSANCRGLRDNQKRYDVFNYLKDTNADIICLQDTHLTKLDSQEVKKICDGEFFLHGTKNNSRGVAILLGKLFEYKIIDSNTDIEGNLLSLDLQISDTKIQLINIYGPNTDNQNFYADVAEKIQSNDQDDTIWCDDFNMTLNPKLDSFNYTSVNNPRARNYVTDLLRESNLVDLFRYFLPDKTRYTWRQRNKLKQARLDYFIVSSSFTHLTISTDIKPGYRTDHSMLELNFEINNFRRGRGTWKLNTSLLKDNQYLQLITIVSEMNTSSMLFLFMNMTI